MEERLWTMEEVKNYFGVKNNKTIHKFITQGLKVFKVGSKDYRFNIKDIKEFEEIQKQANQAEMVKINPVKMKPVHKRLDIDYQKRKINIEQLKVVAISRFI